MTSNSKKALTLLSMGFACSYVLIANAREIKLGNKCDRETCVSVFLKHLDRNPGPRNQSFTAILDYVESDIDGVRGKAHIESRDILCDGRNVVGFKGPNVSIRDGDQVTDEFGMRKQIQIACEKDKTTLYKKIFSIQN